MHDFEELTLVYPNNNYVTKKFAVLIWYDGPKMYVDKDKQLLLIWYDYSDNGESFFLVENSQNIMAYLSGQKTLRQILLEGPTYLVLYDFDKDAFIVQQKLDVDTLLSKYVLPAVDSYIT